MLNRWSPKLKLAFFRWLQIVLVLSLLLQIALPAQAVLAAPNPAPLAQTPSPDDAPIDPATVPMLDVTALPTAETPLVVQMTLPSLPVGLELAVDSAVLTPNATTLLTLTLESQTVTPLSALTITLTLPDGLRTAQGQTGTLTWPVATLDAGQSVTLTVQVEPATPEQTSAVLTITALVQGADYEPVQTTTLVGLAPDGATATTLTEQGAVLQDAAAGIVLLAPPGAAPVGLTLNYTPLYSALAPLATVTVSPTESPNLPAAPTATPTPTTTPISMPTSMPTPMPTPTSVVVDAPLAFYRFYFPLVGNASKLAQPADAVTADAVTPAAVTPEAVSQAVRAAANEPPTPQPSQNVAAYQIWAFTAQQGASQVLTFTQALQMQVAARPWIARGVDPTQLSLWTRESDTEPWLPVAATYDEAQQTFTAWVDHFSQFSLAEALTSAEWLPSVRVFTTDRTTGGASLQYPIDTPKGLGGLAPNLSLSYSSIGTDDLYRQSGDNHYTVQASGVGMGWNVGGINQIARADNHLDGDTPFTQRDYVLTLNGTFVRIHYQDKAWRTDPEIFAKIDRGGTDNGGRHDYAQWIITTADGTVYTFGDAQVADQTFAANSATATFAQAQKGGAYERLAKQWYLVRVQDRSGNQMTYTYQAEQGTVNSCVPQDKAHAYLRWYVRAIYPSQILWSSHPSADPKVNVDPKLQVTFSYAPTDRSDWNIEYADQKNCRQVEFAKRNQLTTVTVAAQVETQWQTLRSYRLTQDYANFPRLRRQRLLLTSLAERGANGTPLREDTFTYQDCATGPGACKASINGVRLRTMNSGWKGAVTYTYTGYQPSANNTICNNHCTRYAVTQVVTDDGLNNTQRTTYYYGPTRPSKTDKEWGAIDNSGEFLGFRRSEATTYAVNAATTVVKQDAVETWQGQRDRPDPRRGRIRHQEVKDAKGTLLSVTENDWEAYPRLVDTWGDKPVTVNNHREKQELVYDTLWVRLEATSVWTDGAGKWTQYVYAKQDQNNLQFGNQTRVLEWSHPETSILLGKADGSEVGTWNYRVQHNGQQLQLLRTTRTEYFPNEGLHLVNFPARVRVYNGAFDPAQPLRNCQAETRTVYDDLNGNYNSLPTKGLVFKTQQALRACNATAALDLHDLDWQETRFAYNDYGSQTVRHLVGGGSATDDWLHTAYDPVYQLFPVRQWLGQAPTFQVTAQYYGANGPTLTAFGAYWGAVAEVCALNQICTHQNYDEFGRRKLRWDYLSPLTARDTLTTNNASVLWGYTTPTSSPGQTATTITEWHSPRSEGNFTRKVYNGLGQLVQTQSPNQDWTKEVAVDYAYDALGQPNRVSVPHLVARYTNLPADLRRPPDYSQGQTTTTYDALGRPLLSTAPNKQQTTYTYVGRASAQWGIGRLGDLSNKVLKRNDLDGLGYLQFIRTYQWNGKTYAPDGLITQTHDVVGNLTRVEQANGLGVTTLTYDLAGHKTNMTDVDMGHWTYAYDRQGKLVTQTDACGNTTTLSYEPRLQRLSRKTFTQSAQNCQTAASAYNVTYAYDGAPSNPPTARGQLTGVAYTDGSYAKALTYNNLGLLASTTLTVSGTSYTTQVGYDADQRPNVTTQPSGEAVSVAYNSLGLTNLLDSQMPGATGPQPLVNGVNYDEAGRLTSLTFPAGGNVVRTQTYAPFKQPDNNGGQLQSIQVKGPSSTLLNLAYQYDSYGNIKQVADGVPGSPAGVQTDNFTYDDQNRLLAGYAQKYTYDPAGRLTKYEDLPTTQDANFPLHGVKALTLPATGSHTLAIRAMGTAAAGGWPQLDLWVNGAKVSSWTVTGAWQTYTNTVTLTGQDKVDLVFANDASDAISDRNLVIGSLQVDSQPPLAPTAAVYDRGVDAAAFDGQDVLPGQAGLYWNGALRFVLKGTAPYSYDANGNLVNRASQTLTWDVENHLQSVKGTGADETYRYDENGQRLQKTVGDQVTTYVSSQYEAQQAICSGQTPAGNTNWQIYDDRGVYLDVDTRTCGYATTPLYFTSLEGTTNHELTTGAQAIYFATATGFRVYVRFADGRTFTPADANAWNWRLTWRATPKNLVSSRLCTGQTPAGNTNWQTYTDGLYLDVDTRACGYTSTPLYQTSLHGLTSHWSLTGITALYSATATGFRVYVRHSTGGGALTPSLANSYGWQLSWSALPAGVQTPTFCTGQTPAGNSNWQVNDSTSLYLDVNTAACGFTATPRYQTSLGGDSHWSNLGVNALYQPTATGFRVYVRYSDGRTLTPAAANSLGWQVQWSAVTGRYDIVTQAYSFNGQRIAQRKDGVLTYLHADQVGSTLLATDASGAVVGGNQPRYFAYGRERTPSLAALPTDYTYTGQKQDGNGLVYMNARYYDPIIGQFISPDTVVPDPTNLLAYQRYMYAIGNPLRYNDPSGHGYWDVINTAVDFVQGVGAQVGYNNTSLVPGGANIYYQKEDESTAMTVGRHVGNVVTTIQSAAEIVIGAGGDVGGAALCGTGVGCVATPAVEAVGTAVMVHGAAVGTTAMVEEGRLLNQVMMAVTKGGSSTSQTEGGRKKWEITKEGTASVKRHNRFGVFSKSKSDGLWWSKDQAGHGGSVWKVFEESSDGLHWIGDADEYGTFILDKHKGDTGVFIPWKELIGVKK